MTDFIEDVRDHLLEIGDPVAMRLAIVDMEDFIATLDDMKQMERDSVGIQLRGRIILTSAGTDDELAGLIAASRRRTRRMLRGKRRMCDDPITRSISATCVKQARADRTIFAGQYWHWPRGEGRKGVLNDPNS